MNKMNRGLIICAVGVIALMLIGMMGTVIAADNNYKIDTNAIKSAIKTKITEEITDRLNARNCTGENCKINILGRNITIRDLSNETKEIIAEKIDTKTGLNLTAEDIDTKTMLKAYLSNGRWALVKYLPNVASAIALKRLEAKCAERNCTIELKEVGAGNKTKLAYEVKTEKDSKVLLIFKKKMPVIAQVDAETGQIISVKKPWWAFIAKDSDESMPSETADAGAVENATV
jgi:hypothetical protein